ncbi:hypothetical protein BJY52DRAFT_1334866 [Lactarius psammicola]|nr:hypothetical protein BJY52DRAFT_1334866 [Lactarius psammicola]
MVHTRGRGAAHPSPSSLPFVRCPCANPRGRGGVSRSLGALPQFAYPMAHTRGRGVPLPRGLLFACRPCTRTRGEGGALGHALRHIHGGWPRFRVPVASRSHVTPTPKPGSTPSLSCGPPERRQGQGEEGRRGGSACRPCVQTRGGGRCAASGIARVARRSRVARGGGGTMGGRGAPSRSRNPLPVTPLLFCATPFCEGGERGKGGAQEIQGEGCARGAGRVAVGEGGSRGGA